MRHKGRIGEYLSAHPCVDCGEDDIRVLDFDHQDPKTKSAAIGMMVARVFPWRLIEAEIAKCAVRCANCHRRRTAAMQGNWRQQWIDARAGPLLLW